MSECCNENLDEALESKKNVCGLIENQTRDNPKLELIDEEVTEPSKNPLHWIQISVQNEPKECIKDIISKKHYICSKCNFKVPKSTKAELLVLLFENSHPEDDDGIVELTPELIKKKFQVFLRTRNQL